MTRNARIDATNASERSLAVVGDAQALGTAAWAARCSGRSVQVRVGGAEQPIARIDAQVRLPSDAVDPGADGRVIQEPTPRADHWIVVTRSGMLEQVLAAHADRMAGANILLAPGGFGGALRAREWFARQNLPVPRIAETTGFPAMGALDADTYQVRAVKRRMPLAAADPGQTADLLAAFRHWLPDLVASDLATTSLGNTNHLIHPPLVITNGVRIARRERFTFYREGIADGVGGLLEAADRERRALVRALGGDDRSGAEWLLRFYADQGMAGETIIEALHSFPAFAATPSPPELDYRYLTDDVPYGIACWAELAVRAGTPHRQLAALNTLAATLLGRPLDAPEGLVDALTEQLHTNAARDLARSSQ